MALVTGPLHSDGASGRFAGSIVFATNRGRKYVRSLVTPANPKSARQTGVRVMMSFLAKYWSQLGTVVRETWDGLATSRNISAFNAFVGENLARWQTNNGPTAEYPAAQVQTAVNPDAVGVDGVILSSSGAAGYASLGALPDSTGAADAIAVMIFRGAAAPSKVWSAAIAVLPVTPGVAWTFVDSPLAAGTYHYKIAYATSDGVIGALSAADNTAVVS